MLLAINTRNIFPLRKIIFGLLFLFVTASPVHAVMTGSEWLLKCKDTDSGSMFDVGFCFGYLNGVWDKEMWFMGDNTGFEMYTKHRGNYHLYPKICMPPKVSLGQLRKIMIKWYKEHPEKLHERVDLQFVFIMRETFPCKSQ